LIDMKLNDEEEDILAGKAGLVPLALVFNSVNPILAQGAALGDVPMLAGFEEDITTAILNGAEVEVNPQMGVLAVVG
jgi:uncharacterized protein